MPKRILRCPNCHARYEATNIQPGARVKCRKCNTVFRMPGAEEPKKDKLVGRTIGGYHILEKIGEGGIGTVYRARQLSLDREVAFKTLKPEFAANQSFVERLTREARAAAQLVHPNIVQTYDVGEDQGVHFIAMELVPGESLHDIIAREGRIDVKRAVDILKQAAFALQGAYHRKIVHRDIKPENLLIMEDGTVKISDFGLAKRIETDASLTQSGTIVGTPRYMPPEQAEGQSIDCRSDIYSLGATIYHAVTGVPPFDAPTAMGVIVKHLNEPLKPVRKLNPRVPPKVAAIIEKMMAKDPNNRYQTPSELLQAIEDAEATLDADLAVAETVVSEAETVVAPSKTPPTREETETPEVAARKRQLTPIKIMIFSLIALAIVLCVVIVAYTYRQKKEEEERFASLFEELRSLAMELSQEDKYQAAINALDKFPLDRAPKEWQRKVINAKKELREYARRKYEKVVESAEKNVKAGDFEKAIWQYEEVVENYGVPEIVDDARRRIEEVKQRQQDFLKKEIKEIAALLRDPRELPRARERYAALVQKLSRMELTDEVRAAIRNLTEAFPKRHARSRRLTVSKSRPADFTSISQAIAAAGGGDVIEILDSETYLEPTIASLQTNITIRGKESTPPRIKWNRVSTRGKKGSPFTGLQPLIAAGPGWKIENIIIDGNGAVSGIILPETGKTTILRSAIVNTWGYAICVGRPRRSEYRRVLVPLKPPRHSFILEVRNCIIAGAGNDMLPLIIFDLVSTSSLSFTFDHNTVYGAKICFACLGDSTGNGKILVTNNIFKDIHLLVMSEAKKFRMESVFDYNCYSPEVQVFFRDASMKTVKKFEEWKTLIKGDSHSIIAEPRLVAPADGNFALSEKSPCRGKGESASDMGSSITYTVGYRAQKAAAPQPRPGKPKQRPVPPPGKPAPEKVDEQLAALIKSQRFREAVNFVKSHLPGSPWQKEKAEHLARIISLKKTVIDRINEEKNIPVRVTVARRNKAFIGGFYVAADADSVTIAMRGGKRETLKWTDLNHLEFYEIAQSCIEPTDYSAHLALGIYLYECGELNKAEERFKYVKAGKKDPEARIADRLLQKLSGGGPKLPR